MDNKSCLDCRFFYDVWSDGTGKCERAHGGIIHESLGARCKAFKEEEYMEHFDPDD